MYIIRGTNQYLYTGITTEPSRRLSEHQHGKRKAKFFNSTNAEAMVFLCEVINRSAAAKEESRIKKLTKIEKLKLIDSDENQLNKSLMGVLCN